MIGPKSNTTQANWTWRVKKERLEQVCGIYFKKGICLILFSTAVLNISWDVSSRGLLSNDRGWLHCNPPWKYYASEGWGCQWPRTRSHNLHFGVPTLLTARASLCTCCWCPCCHCLASNTVVVGVSTYIVTTAQLINSKESEVLPKLGLTDLEYCCALESFTHWHCNSDFCLHISYEYSKQGDSLTPVSKVKIVNPGQKSSTENKCKLLA